MFACCDYSGRICIFDGSHVTWDTGSASHMISASSSSLQEKPIKRKIFAGILLAKKWRNICFMYSKRIIVCPAMTQSFEKGEFPTIKDCHFPMNDASARKHLFWGIKSLQSRRI